jgi:hypothetical protein
MALTPAMESPMPEANAAHTTHAPDLSPPADKGVRLFHIPTLDRAALMRHAHQIARRGRPFMASYAEALRHGLKAAWAMLATRREFAAVRTRVAPRILTAEQRAASERATRRCGSSYMPF